jgi:hypothetical protein
VAVEQLDDLGEIHQRPGRPVDLVDDDGVDPMLRDVGEQVLQGGAVQGSAGEPAII